MNREQMIAWLTLEGWDSVDCYGSCFARKFAEGKCIPKSALTYVPTTYGRLSWLAIAEDTQWIGWADPDLARILEHA